MSKVSVLKCNFNKKEHLEAVVRLMNAYIADEMGGGRPIEGRRALYLVDGLNNQPNALVLLAFLDGQIVGLCNAFESFATFTVQKCINVHDLIVMKEHRGKGIGRALLQEVVDIADDRKCSKVTLEVREDNKVAQSLYYSMEFGPTNPPMKFWVKKLPYEREP